MLFLRLRTSNACVKHVERITNDSLVKYNNAVVEDGNFVFLLYDRMIEQSRCHRFSYLWSSKQNWGIF